MFVFEDAVAIIRCKVHQRLRLIGKSGFRFEMRISDFAIKREIRKTDFTSEKFVLAVDFN